MTSELIGQRSLRFRDDQLVARFIWRWLTIELPIVHHRRVFGLLLDVNLSYTMVTSVWRNSFQACCSPDCFCSRQVVTRVRWISGHWCDEWGEVTRDRGKLQDPFQGGNLEPTFIVNVLSHVTELSMDVHGSASSSHRLCLGKTTEAAVWEPPASGDGRIAYAKSVIFAMLKTRGAEIDN